MSITNTYTFARMAAVIAGVALVLTSFAPAVGAQTTTTSTTTTTTASVTTPFVRDLTIGSTGADVTALQAWLIARGHTIPAGATGYFGLQTRTALAAMQLAQSIVPAVGYFGPITRATVNNLLSTPTPQPGGGQNNSDDNDILRGGEGSLDVGGNLADVENEVEEGEEEVNVLGLELEADDSDLMLTRADVEFTLSGTGSNRLNRYINEVHLMLDGEELDTLSVKDARRSGDVYRFRFTNLDGIIREGDDAELYIAVTAVRNVDSGDTAKVIMVNIPANGIRATDAKGISDTYDGGNSETFSVVDATGGDLNISLNSNTPRTGSATIDKDKDTNNVTLLTFDLSAKSQDVVVDRIPVTIETSEDEGVDGAVKRVKLMSGSKTLDTVSVPASATTTFIAVFDDLNLDIEEGDKVTLKVVVDLHDQDDTTFASGTTLRASVVHGGVQWDAEDANGDDADRSGSAIGNIQSFYATGILVASGSTSAEDKAFGTSGEEQGDFSIQFKITALEEDFYIYKNAASAEASTTAGVTYVVYQDSTATTTLTGAELSDNLTATSQSGDTSDYFLVREGDTRTFTLQVVLNPNTTGFYRVKLDTVRYDLSDDSDPSDDEAYTVPDESEFWTQSVQING